MHKPGISNPSRLVATISEETDPEGLQYIINPITLSWPRVKTRHPDAAEIVFQYSYKYILPSQYIFSVVFLIVW